MGAPSKTPIEALYLETGKLPIKYIIQCRRLMYWWHLVKQDKNKLISKFYTAQKNIPVKGDRTLQVEKDKVELNINLNDEDLLKMSKRKFKKFVKQKIYQKAFEKLLEKKP